MPRVDKGNSRLLQSHGGASVPALRRAGAVNFTANEKQVWKDRPVGLFSFPNTSEEAAYMSVEVTNLENNEYELSLGKDVLGTIEDINYPINHKPVFSQQSNPLVLHRFTDSSTLSGAMFTIPAQSRVHVALRLKRDREDIQAFSVAFDEHAGQTRESPNVWEQPEIKSLEWVPAPSAQDVEVAVYSTPRRFLFWDLTPDADWVRFRPWNVVPRAGRLFWSLPFFHHPECIVRVSNHSPFSMSVSPCLVINREDAAGKAMRPPQKEPLETQTLNSGEAREWPCPLALSDTRLPREEADQMRLHALAEVYGPSATSLGLVNASEILKAEYQPFFSRISDWITLVGLFCFAAVFLLWSTYGIPVLVTPQLDVMLHFRGFVRGELPPGIDARDPLRVQLSPGEIPGLYDPKQHTFQFKFERTWVGCKWPFGWRSKEDTFDVVVSDDKGLYQFTPLKGQKLMLFPAPHAPQVLGDIEGSPSTVQIQRQGASHALDKANEALDSATQLLQQRQSAKAKIEEANQFITSANGLLTDLPPDTPEKKTLEKAQNRLSGLQSQQDQLEKSLNDEQHAENAVRNALTDADSAIQSARLSLNANNKEGATSEASIAKTQLETASRQLHQIRDPSVQQELFNHLQTTQNNLGQLRADINKLVSPPPNTDINRSHNQPPVVPIPVATQVWQQAYSALLVGNWSKAIATAERAPNDPKAYAISAIAHHHLGEDSAAQTNLTTAENLGNKPGTDAALLQVAQGYINKNEAPKGSLQSAKLRIAQYEAAMRQDPTLALAYIMKLRQLMIIHITQNSVLDMSTQITATTQQAISKVPGFKMIAKDTILLKELRDPPYDKSGLVKQFTYPLFTEALK